MPSLPTRSGNVVVTGAYGHNNYFEQLPSPPEYSVAIAPQFAGEVAYISPNIFFSVGIKRNGQIVWWGDPWHHAKTKDEDPLWDPPALDWLSGLPLNIVRIAGHATALDSLGKVFQTIPELSYRPNFIERLEITDATPMPSDLSDVVEITSSSFFSAALRRNGKVDVWGFFRVPPNSPNARPSGYDGVYYRPAAELMLEAFGPEGLTNVVQISSPREYEHLLALRSDGTVTGLGYVWGKDGYFKHQATDSIPIELANMNIVRVYAGNYFNVALTANGTLRGWTNPLDTADGPVPSDTFMQKIAAATGVVKVAIGNTHVAWLTTNGTVHTAHAFEGYTSFNGSQLPGSYPQTNTLDWRNVIDIYAGGLRTYGIVLPTNALSIRSPSSSLFTLDSTNYTFPTAVVGIPQKTRSFTVQNTGASPTTFNATLAGENSRDFQIVGLSGNITLAPGASTNITVLFAPVDVGLSKKAYLRVASDSAESVVNLNGDAVSSQTDGNGINPALNHVFRDFNVDLNEPINGLQFLSSLGLYTPQSIMDLRHGAQMVQKSGSNATVELRLQTTNDLQNTPFDDYKTIIETIPMPGNKGFLRVRAGNN